MRKQPSPLTGPATLESPRFPSKGSFKGDIDIDTDVEVDVDIDSYLGCLREASKSVEVLLNGIQAVVVLTLIIPHTI